MAFMLSENQASLASASASEAHNEKDVREGVAVAGPGSSVSSQLSLKPSSHSLDKDVVLRRLRHHKTMTRVKNAFHSVMSAPPPLDDDSDDKWMQRGNIFGFP